MRIPGNALLAASALALLAACGGASDAPSEPTPAPAPPSEVSEENQAPEEASSTPPQTEDVAEAPAADPSAAFADLPEPYKSADYARGARTFKLCVSCHLLEEGAGHRVGPNLAGFFGREAGTAEGFAYSTALEEADFIWTPEQLDAWLANPRSFLPGNRMSFSGVRRDDDRNAVIAYLMVETGWSPEAE